MCTTGPLKQLISRPHADIDECSERAIACPGLNEACINEEGSFHCDCADGFIRRDSICVENKPSGGWMRQQRRRPRAQASPQMSHV